jgi:hypothetical protein
LVLSSRCPNRYSRVVRLGARAAEVNVGCSDEEPRLNWWIALILPETTARMEHVCGFSYSV